MKKNILIGVSGGIAAYKVCDLVSKLTQKDYEVRVIMTPDATEFVGPLTFEALSRNPVLLDGMHFVKEGITHIELGNWADVILIAPASANTIARLVHGFGDTLLCATVLASQCPVLIAPAMNTHMLEKPVTQRNLQLARELGFEIIESESGHLACGIVGAGRLPSTPVLMELLENRLKEDPFRPDLFMTEEQMLETIASCKDEKEILSLARALEQKKPLRGTQVLVSAGPTKEAIDPVRFLSNHSSGKQGYAIARAAASWGADTVLVSGPTSLEPPEGVDVLLVESALEMKEAMETYFPKADFTIMAAAVADYRPKTVHDHKMKKGAESLVIELEANPDILKALGKQKQDNQILCGFAMETQDLIENARKKLESKRLDLIAANSLKQEGAGFQGSTNILTLLFRDGEKVQLEKLSKEALGYVLLAWMLLYGKKENDL